MTIGKSISISSLVSGSACPLRLYHEQVVNTPPHITGYPRYTVCKQISYHLGTPLDAPGIWEECCAVDPYLAESYREFLDNSVKNCASHDWRVPSGTDVRVSSERYGIYGTIDRVFDAPPYFSLVRASRAPSVGIYRQDRLRVLCYALCLEEMLNKPVPGGTVEYIPDGIGRFHAVQPRDRREFIQARKMASDVLSGKVPKKPPDAPCTACRFMDQCTPGVRRLSDLMD